TLGWRVIFALNVPIGLVAMVILLARYPRRGLSSVPPVIDYLGAVCLVAGITPLFLALSLGGHGLAWSSPVLLGLAVVGMAVLAAFVWVERRAAQPIVPLGMLASRGVGIP